jgi:hypothetical protein
VLSVFLGRVRCFQLRARLGRPAGFQDPQSHFEDSTLWTEPLTCDSRIRHTLQGKVLQVAEIHVDAIHKTQEERSGNFWPSCDIKEACTM